MIPTIIVLFGPGYSWITLHEIEKHDPNHIVIDVYAQQWAKTGRSSTSAGLQLNP